LKVITKSSEVGYPAVRVVWSSSQIHPIGGGVLGIIHVCMLPIVKHRLQVPVPHLDKLAIVTYASIPIKVLNGVIINVEIIRGRVNPCHSMPFTHVLQGRGVGFVVRVNRESIHRCVVAVVSGVIIKAKLRFNVNPSAGSIIAYISPMKFWFFPRLIGVGHHGAVRVAIPVVPVGVGGNR